MPAWIPPAITALGGVLGSFIGARQSGRNIQRTNQANMRMAEYSYNKDLEMWHRQNAYNSPEAQMQRFEDAGLNKHMIYGQGTPGNATAFPTYSPALMDYRGTPSAMAESMMQTTGSLTDYLMNRQEAEKVKQAKYETAIKYYENVFKSMEQPGRNIQYMIDKFRSEEFINMDDDQKRQLIRQELLAGMSQNQVDILAQQLKNKYQQEVNRLAEQNLSLGDSVKIKLGALLLEALGMNPEEILNLNR